jgi:protein-L-isoaspartate(D-aspartate) O-methyltransferase
MERRRRSPHDSLARRLRRQGYIRSRAVTAAFRAVPRHLFLPGVSPRVASLDEAVEIEVGATSTIAARPGLVAWMLEQLALEPGQRVLEIGTGTGYTAALIAQVVGDTGTVVTVELDEDVAAAARGNLRRSGYEGVRVVTGDGTGGYPGSVPYDSILLSAAAQDISSAWREQLKPGGRLVLPLSIGGVQHLFAFVAKKEHLQSIAVAGGGFEAMRGAFGGTGDAYDLGPEPGLVFWSHSPSPVEPATLYEWLRTPARAVTTGLTVTLGEVWDGLYQWLALRGNFCTLSAEGNAVDQNLVPPLSGYDDDEGRHRFTSGLLGNTALCLLSREPDHSLSDDPTHPTPFVLWLQEFGPRDSLAPRVLQWVHAWDRAGRPGSDALQVRIYPAGAAYLPALEELVLRQPWSDLVVTVKAET